MPVATNTIRLVPRNFHDDATLTTQLAAVSGFPVENTQDTQRTRVWRSEDGSDQYINGTYDDGLLRDAGFFGFFRHRCHGGSVRLQLYSDAAWSAQVYDSGFNDIINMTPTDGFNWGVDIYSDGNSDIDPFITETPYWIWFSSSAPHLSYKISFSGNVSTYGYDYWQISRIVLGPYKALPYTALYDFPLGIVNQTDRNRSRGGSLRTNRGVDWRTLQLDIKRVPEGERADWMDIKHYMGTSRDGVISVFPEEGTRKERDNIFNFKFSAIDPVLQWHHDYVSTRLQIEEV